MVGNQIAVATAMYIRDQHKAIWSFGYDQLAGGQEHIELNDLAADPEELTNLFTTHQEITHQLIGILRQKMD